MSQFLGFVTAFFVMGWAVRWYFRQGHLSSDQQLHPNHEPQVITNVTRWETLDEVTLLEPFADTVTIEARPRVLLTDDSESDEEEPSEMDMAVVEDDTSAVVEDEAVADSYTAESAEEAVIGFCARCRDKREVVNPTLTHTKKGKAAIRGTCEVCGAGMFVFISEEKAESGVWGSDSE